MASNELKEITRPLLDRAIEGIEIQDQRNKRLMNLLRKNVPDQIPRKEKSSSIKLWQKQLDLKRAKKNA